MTRGEILFTMVIMAVVLGGCLLAFVISMNARPSGDSSGTNEPPKPRIVLPTDCDIYTFSLDSQLKPEEWQMILNAGWSFLACNTEPYTYYAGSYPDAPRHHGTRWHYVFRRTGSKKELIFED